MRKSTVEAMIDNFQPYFNFSDNLAYPVDVDLVYSDYTFVITAEHGPMSLSKGFKNDCHPAQVENFLNECLYYFTGGLDGRKDR